MRIRLLIAIVIVGLAVSNCRGPGNHPNGDRDAETASNAGSHRNRPNSNNTAVTASSSGSHGNSEPAGAVATTAGPTANPASAGGSDQIQTAQNVINCDKEVHTTLAASPAIVRYHQVGDKVVEDEATTLIWTADNADSVRIDPIGPVTGTSGQAVVKLAPSKSDFGPIHDLREYKITASNTCGGSHTTIVAVEIAGSIDPEIVAADLPPVLPRTGSPLPLIGLLGLGSLLSGLVLRMFRKG